MNKHIYTAILTEYNGEQEYSFPLAIEAESMDRASEIADKIAAQWYGDDATLDESGMWYNANCSWSISQIWEEYHDFVFIDENTTVPCIVRYEIRPEA